LASGNETLRDVIAAQARRFEKHGFLEYGNQRFSYADVDDRTDRVATALTHLGLRAGDRVALLMKNRPEFLFFLWGAAKIGVIAVPLDPGGSAQYIAAALAQTTPSAVVTETRHKELRSQFPADKHWIVVDDESFLDEPFRGLERSASVLRFWPDLSPDAAALIAFTTGRRGTRKPVVLSHRNLVAAAGQLVQPFRIDETDRFVCLLPMSWVFSQVFLTLTPWVVGATAVLADMSQSSARDCVVAGRASVTAGTPGLFESLLDASGSSGRAGSALRLAVCYAGVVGERVLHEFENSYDAFVVEGYGVLEATCLTCANPYTGVRKRGSVGLPLPGQQCRLADPYGNDVPSGATGEILVRGPNVMTGYYGDSAASASVLRDGWLHTGDFGTVDADGYYYLAGGSESRRESPAS
jgi:long-chain acyl-CoA synthetase